MLNIKECDRIVVETNAKMDRIIKWYEENREWVDDIEFHSPIPSGLIDFQEEDIKLAYEPENQLVRMYLYMGGAYVCSFKYDPHTRKPGKPFFPPGLSEDKQGAALMILGMDNTLWKCAFKYQALMNFAAHFKNVVEVSERKRNSLTKHQAKRLGRLEKREVSLYTTTYKLTNVESTIDGTPPPAKRKYTKPTSEVSVRGFYRTTKTGKRVWVRPFKRYKGGENNGPKTYKV